MRTKNEKLKRFCEKCGTELIHIRMPGDKLIACNWDGPVPYIEVHAGIDEFVTQDRKVVKGYPACASAIVKLCGDVEIQHGYKVHRCEA